MPIDESAALIAERTALFETLRALAPEEWEAASLCDGWRVRDVAAHVALELRLRDALVGVLRKRGDFNAFMGEYVPRRADRPVDDLLSDFARFAATDRTPPTIRAVDQAIDAFVHHHDVAVPLGRTVPTDPVRLRWMADGMLGASRLIGSAQRTKGLRLIATDIDWHHGTGPEVHGPTAALIVTACGRTALRGELSGGGAEILAGRS